MPPAGTAAEWTKDQPSLQEGSVNRMPKAKRGPERKAWPIKRDGCELSPPVGSYRALPGGYKDH